MQLTVNSETSVNIKHYYEKPKISKKNVQKANSQRHDLSDALNEIKIERIRYNYATYSSFWYVTSPSTQLFMNCVWGGVRGR